MISIKVKDKESAEKILNELISKYKEKVLSYDIEEFSREIRPEEGNIYAHRKISRKGGSIYVTIPSSIAEFMGLKRDDMLLFVGRGRTKRVYIEKIGYRLLREG
ncbi:MAG: hypothetical protein QXG34_04045 [Candidatus Bathyarchaeia archaeon]